MTPFAPASSARKVRYQIFSQDTAVVGICRQRARAWRLCAAENGGVAIRAGDGGFDIGGGDDDDFRSRGVVLFAIAGRGRATLRERSPQRFFDSRDRDCARPQQGGRIAA